MPQRMERPMRESLYFDDLSVGQKFVTAALRVTTDEIKEFARKYDPQPFHLDESTAKATMFGGLAASGWHSAALLMRLVVESGPPLAGGVIGSGIDELRWLRPVRPGDELHAELEVLEARPSTSRPTQGRVRMLNTLIAQDGVAVMSLIANITVPRRPQ
jgi:acyl dehydratase